MTDRLTGINVVAINGQIPIDWAGKNRKRLEKMDSIACRPSYQHLGCITLTIAGRQYTIRAEDAMKKIEAALQAQVSLFPEEGKGGVFKSPKPNQ